MYGGHQVSLFTILPVVAKLLKVTTNQVPTLYFSILPGVNMGGGGYIYIYVYIYVGSGGGLGCTSAGYAAWGGGGGGGGASASVYFIDFTVFLFVLHSWF